MRRIKFRAWDKETNVMLTEPMCHIIINLHGQITNLQNGCGNSTYELMQFTGLHDKNGKEIYEGDIVTIPSGYGGDTFYKETKGIVQYEESEFYPHNIFDSHGCVMQDWYWKELTVIGNIYENPELLT